MSYPFFYEESLSPGSASFILSEETSKHCIQVLRMKTGEQLELTDGKGNIVTAAIITEDKRACGVKVLATRQQPRPARTVCIGISLLKNASRFEWFLEKATEIGVTEITPLLCTRTEKQHFRLDRMRNILISAMLQSRQAWLPVLHEPTAVNKVIVGAPQKQKLVAHCMDGQKQSLSEIAVAADALMLIGPEGDFTLEEINNCLANGYTPVTLGNTRLRTETAGIVAATLLINM